MANKCSRPSPLGDSGERTVDQMLDCYFPVSNQASEHGAHAGAREVSGAAVQRDDTGTTQAEVVLQGQTHPVDLALVGSTA